MGVDRRCSTPAAAAWPARSASRPETLRRVDQGRRTRAAARRARSRTDASDRRDGFSCREQIAQTTDRQALHLADVLWLAEHRDGARDLGELPERLAMPERPNEFGARDATRSRLASSPRRRGGIGCRRGVEKETVSRVAVVTGASAGVGRATAREFARRGYDVGLIARGVDGLEAARSEIEEMGRRALYVSTDVADAEAVERAAARIEEELGEIEVWTNVAFSNVFSEFRS